jgi:hypothetical protein
MSSQCHVVLFFSNAHRFHLSFYLNGEHKPCSTGYVAGLASVRRDYCAGRPPAPEAGGKSGVDATLQGQYPWAEFFDCLLCLGWVRPWLL